MDCYITSKNDNNFRLAFKLTEYSIVTSIVWANDHKLLQESNLTVRQPRKVPIMS